MERAEPFERLVDRSAADVAMEEVADLFSGEAVGRSLQSLSDAIGNGVSDAVTEEGVGGVGTVAVIDTKSQADLGGATWDCLFNGRLRQLTDRGEPGGQKRSFRPVSPSRNSHRPGATHFPLADGEGGSACNRPYRLCSSRPAESLRLSSIRCAAFRCGCRDDPGPRRACLPEP